MTPQRSEKVTQVTQMGSSPQPAAGKLVKKAPCLYQSPAGIFYAIIKGKNRLNLKRNLQTMDRGVADQMLAELRSEMADGTASPSSHIAHGLTFGDAGAQWLASQIQIKIRTRERRQQCLDALKPWFVKRPLNLISRLEIEKWSIDRSPVVSPRTYNMELETLQMVFNWALGHELVLKNPAEKMARLKLPKPNAEVPSRTEFTALLTEMRRNKKLNRKREGVGSDGAEMVEFMAYSGCRVGEATEMTWGRVQFEMNRIGVWGTKTDAADRIVPLFPPLRRLLKDMLAALPKKPQPSDKIFRIKSPKKAIRTACRNLGLPMYHPHTFRHLAFTLWIESGASFAVAAKWGGHSDNGVLAARVYNHVRVEHEEQAVGRVTFDAAAEKMVNAA